MLILDEIRVCCSGAEQVHPYCHFTFHLAFCSLPVYRYRIQISGFRKCESCRVSFSYSWNWSFESVIEPTTGLKVAKVTGARPMKKRITISNEFRGRHESSPPLFPEPSLTCSLT